MRRLAPVALVLVLGCGSPPAGKKPVEPTEEEDAAPPPARRDAASAPMADAGALSSDAGAAPTDAAPMFPRRPSCTTAPVLDNGDFEKPASGATVPGWQLQNLGTGTVQFDPIGGYAGTGALAFRVPEDGTAGGAVARQTVTLAPYTGYTFRARVATGNMRPRGDGFFLFSVVVRNGNRTYAVGPRKQDRTDLDYGSYTSDFGTGPDGKVEIEIRSAGAGAFLVDDVTLTCSDRSQRYAGQSLVLTVYDNHVQAATPTNIEKVVGDADKALGSYAALSGQTDPVKPSAFPVVAATTEPRGNPALWTDGVTSMLWSVPGYVPQSLMIALARNFERPWSFEDDWAHLLVYHAAETNNLVLGAPETSGRGRDARRSYQQIYDATWRAGGCAIGRGLVWKNILIRDMVGWEPFQKTFRYFDALPAAELPPTRWERLRRWHDKLAEFSGMDVWATFTPTDRMLMEARYNAPALPALRPLATIPAATLMAPLTTVQWDSATARERPTRNRLPDDCPMATAAGPTEGLYAYPFSQYVYRLGRRWKRLQAGHSLLAGQATGTVIFIVRGDGKELFKSAVVRDAMPRPLDLDVSTVDRLELIVTDAGDGGGQDGAVWSAPRLVR